MATSKSAPPQPPLPDALLVAPGSEAATGGIRPGVHVRVVGGPAADEYGTVVKWISDRGQWAVILAKGVKLGIPPGNLRPVECVHEGETLIIADRSGLRGQGEIQGRDAATGRMRVELIESDDGSRARPAPHLPLSGGAAVAMDKRTPSQNVANSTRYADTPLSCSEPRGSSRSCSTDGQVRAGALAGHRSRSPRRPRPAPDGVPRTTRDGAPADAHVGSPGGSSRSCGGRPCTNDAKQIGKVSGHTNPRGNRESFGPDKPVHRKGHPAYEQTRPRSPPTPMAVTKHMELVDVAASCAGTGWPLRFRSPVAPECHVHTEDLARVFECTLPSQGIEYKLVNNRNVAASQFAFGDGKGMGNIQLYLTMHDRPTGNCRLNCGQSSWLLRVREALLRSSWFMDIGDVAAALPARMRAELVVLPALSDRASPRDIIASLKPVAMRVGLGGHAAIEHYITSRNGARSADLPRCRTVSIAARLFILQVELAVHISEIGRA